MRRCATSGGEECRRRYRFPQQQAEPREITWRGKFVLYFETWQRGSVVAIRTPNRTDGMNITCSTTRSGAVMMMGCCTCGDDHALRAGIQ